MRFLLQVYASRGQRPDAFHRVLHVFVCTSCQPNSLRVFRAQLPRANEFYSPDPPVEKTVLKQAYDDPEIEKRVCWECGLPCGTPDVDQNEENEDKDEAEDVKESPDAAPADGTAASGSTGGKKKKKSKSEKKKERQAVEEVGAIANRCEECARRIRNGDGPAMFTERELTTSAAYLLDDDSDEDAPDEAAKKAAKAEEEPKPTEADEVPPDDTDPMKEVEACILAHSAASKSGGARESAENAVIEEKLNEFKERVAKDRDHVIDKSEADAFDDWAKDRGETDKAFIRFNRYARYNNGHVIRYCFGGSPLWFAVPNRLATDPPVCPCCGAARTFEMQIQPQLIALLKGTWGIEDRLDFGVICIYSCSESCPGQGKPGKYLEEFAHVQCEPVDGWLPKGG